jgi:hypothetical protein
MTLEWSRLKPTATALRFRNCRKFCEMLLASTTLWLVRSSSALVLRRRLPASVFVKNDSQPVVTRGGEVPLVRIVARRNDLRFGVAWSDASNDPCPASYPG